MTTREVSFLDSTQHFGWLDGASPLRREFELSIAPGRMRGLRVYSEGAALAATLLPLAGPGGVVAGPVEFRMGPAAKIEGSASLPDGTPFRPDAAAKRRLSILAASYWDDDITAEADYVDDDGRFLLKAVRPGFYRIQLEGGGKEYRWSEPPATWQWLEAGRAFSRDLKLAPWAGVCVAQMPRLEPYPGINPPHSILFRMSNPKERWIVGLPAGAQDAAMASKLLFSDEASFSFLQDSQGAWLPRRRAGRWSNLSAKAVPGRYDVYLLETTDKFRRPSVRVLAAQRSVPVEAGAITKLRFLQDVKLKSGDASLRGHVKYAVRPRRGALHEARGLAELHAMAAPRLDFYEAAGAYAGSVFLSVSADELGSLIEGVEKDNPVMVSQYADRWPYEYNMEGLAPGTYRIEVVAHGYKTHVFTRTLEAGKTAELEVNLDAP